MTFTSGGAAVQSSQISGSLNGLNNVTMMGWVRVDNEDMLKSVKPLIFFRGSNGGVCGIHIADKNLRFHWNDGYYGWSTTHYFKVYGCRPLDACGTCGSFRRIPCIS